jgi:Fic family protein
MSTYHHWEMLRDYEQDAASLAVDELRHLGALWQEQRERIEQMEAGREFRARLLRRWAIETGLIERLYDLDRGTTEVLVERGIEAALISRSATDREPTVVAAIINDQLEAVEWLFDFVSQRRELGTSFIKELHALLTRHQPYVEGVDTRGGVVRLRVERGVWKVHPNSPTRPDGSVHEYCPPEQVASEMDRLVALHAEHRQQDVPPEVEAAWLHHRFTQIHPFQDGNGRVARCLASLMLIRARLFPVVVANDRRADYIAALESADDGDLVPLVGFFARQERAALLDALSVAEKAIGATRVRDAIRATQEQLGRRRDALIEEWRSATETAACLQKRAEERLAELAGDLSDQLGATLADLDEEARFFEQSAYPGAANSHWFRWQIIETARELRYFANLQAYAGWSRLVLQVLGKSEILVSFHGLGDDFRGLLAVSACFFRHSETEEGQQPFTDLTTLGDGFLQINYREPYADAEQRFGEWIEGVLLEGIEIWRSGL